MRPTIRRLLLSVGAVAIACGILLAADSDWTWALFAAYPLVLLMPRGRPLARWCPVVLALAVVALSAAGARPGGDFVVAGFAALFILVISPLLAFRRDGRRHRIARALGFSCIVAMASVVVTRWPLRLAFLASRSDLNAFAKRLEMGYRTSGPERVGRFFIRKAEMRDGRPCLRIDDDPAGCDGFVRNPRRGPGGKPLGPSNLAFNLWSAVRLDDDWAFISED